MLHPLDILVSILIVNGEVTLAYLIVNVVRPRASKEML
jgi:hypothetical protein